MERLRYEHYLKRAEAELEAKNYTKAREWCTRCIEEDKSCKYALSALLTRSSAFVKCGRLEEGLFDADSALKDYPKSTAAHTRRAESLVEMKKYWSAAESYSQAVKYGERSMEGDSCIWKCLQHMTVDDISTQLCSILTTATNDGLVSKPTSKQLTESELEEAVYKMVSDSLERRPVFPKYTEVLFKWLRVGLQSACLYAHRSRVYYFAKKYSQAHSDALSALEEIKNLEQANVECVTQKELRQLKSFSSFVLAESLLASKGHPGRDVHSALEWYKRAAEWDDFDQQIFAEKIKQCTFCGFSTNSESTPTRPSVSYEKTLAKNAILVQVTLTLARNSKESFSGDCRNRLRERVAKALEIAVNKVALESIKTTRSKDGVIHVVLQVELRTEDDPVEHCKKPLESLQSLLKEDTDLELVDSPVMESVPLVENTFPTTQAGINLPEEATSQESAKEKTSSNKVGYDLVLSNGQRAPKKPRHVFGISKLLLDPTQASQEIWAQLQDGSCRWRQTATEIKLLALKA